jgi:hypothetical protein
MSEQNPRPARPGTSLRPIKNASDFRATLIAYFAALHPDASPAEVKREADDAMIQLGEAFYLALSGLGISDEPDSEDEPSAASEPRLRLLAAISALVPVASESERQTRWNAKAAEKKRLASERRSAARLRKREATTPTKMAEGDRRRPA